MARSWSVLVGRELITLRLGFGPGGGAGRADLASWFAETLSRDVLIDICAALATFEAHRTPTSALVERVHAALQRGDLIATREPLYAPGGMPAGEKKDKRADDAPPPADDKTWIAVRLMDDGDPPKPVAFKRFKIELPTGELREGMLDADGQAYVGGIDPGSCKVTFPDLDPKAWSRA